MLYRPLTCLEICAGGGGQALGLEAVGFEHVALVEIEKPYCDVLKTNRPNWNVICSDIKDFDATHYKNVDLFAGGVPCPPFSVAGKKLGKDDERDLFPEALRLIGECTPKTVMLENVRGFLDPIFSDHRRFVLTTLENLGYTVSIKLLNSSDYGVPQLRPRVVIIGVRKDLNSVFSYPKPSINPSPTVGETLYDLMASNGWEGATLWAENANKIAPTLVGGSKKHGGPDLGPVRARNAWLTLGVDGRGVANEPPAPDFNGVPRLTVRMIARLQGFPDDWTFGTRKTVACRMIGNAFPPPVAKAIGEKLKDCLFYATESNEREEQLSQEII